EVSDLDVPPFLARARIERDQIVVGRLEKEVVPPHGRAAVTDVRAALRPPKIPPQLAPIARVEGPDIIWSRHVENVIDVEDRALDAARARGAELSRALAADDHVAATAAAAAATAAAKASRRRRRSAADTL